MAADRTAPTLGRGRILSQRSIWEQVRAHMAQSPAFQVEAALPNTFVGLLAALDKATDAAANLG